MGPSSNIGLLLGQEESQGTYEVYVYSVFIMRESTEVPQW